MRKGANIFIGVVTILFLVLLIHRQVSAPQKVQKQSVGRIRAEVQNPLSIQTMRNKSYPGSNLVIEETLPRGSNYSRFIAHYRSDGLKIYGLLTIPDLEKPENGFPAINFIHGHLDEKSYSPIERYVQYQDAFARNGFVTFKPDLRGHGKSEGTPVQSTFSPDYVTDALNAKSSLQKLSEVDPKKIGMWGHSMGGGITLRSMVVSPDIKAGVIWAGVVGDYKDLLERYRFRISWLNTASAAALAKSDWKPVDPYFHLIEISGPLQLHHGTKDLSVPLEFSSHLEKALKKADKQVEFYKYEGSDHNISQSYDLAMQRSLAFFKMYLK